MHAPLYFCKTLNFDPRYKEKGLFGTLIFNFFLFLDLLLGMRFTKNPFTVDVKRSGLESVERIISLKEL